MSIYQQEFIPTYLCIKRHTVTGLLYFCKSTLPEKEMIKYKGSGKYWKKHLNKHGRNIETIWYCLFENKEELSKFAVMCSEQWDVVKIKDINGQKIWANLRPENGIDGTPSGTVFAEDHKKNMRNSALSRKPPTQVTIDKIKATKIANGTSNTNTIESITNGAIKRKGQKRTDKQKQNMKDAFTEEVKLKLRKPKSKASATASAKSRTGLKRSEETKQKMRKPHKSYKKKPPMTDSHKRNLSIAKKGKTWEELYGIEGAQNRRIAASIKKQQRKLEKEANAASQTP